MGFSSGTRGLSDWLRPTCLASSILSKPFSTLPVSVLRERDKALLLVLKVLFGFGCYRVQSSSVSLRGGLNPRGNLISAYDEITLSLRSS